MRERVGAGAAAVVILAAGLGVRAFTGGAFAKYAGVALYAALVYALVVLVAALSPGRCAVLALGFCWAVELAQLTPWPAALSARSVVARLVLGSTFNPPDLFWYAVGVAAMLALHLGVRVVRRRA